EDGIRDDLVTGVQTCALPILMEVIAATVDVLGMPGRVERVVEREGLALMTVHVLHRVAKLAREPARADEREVVRTAHRQIPGLRSEERRVGKECRSRGWREAA